MDAKNTIDLFLHDATGGNAGGRHRLTLEKKTFIASDTAKALREQWNAAGRDQAYVLLRLTESDGSNPHHITGWDGRDTFVCFTESGLAYVPFRKLQEMVTDSQWNPETRLIAVRTPVLRENMERTDVDVLMDRVRKTLIKSGKVRRPSRFKSMSRYYESSEDVAKDKNQAKKKALGPKGELDMVAAPKSTHEVPEEPPGRDKFMKTGKKADRKAESLNWQNVDEATGKVKRRGLSHPMMGGKDCATKKGANGETNQNTTTRSEDTDPQLDKRQQIDTRSEGGKNQGEAGNAGGTTDPQMDKRQQIDVRHEDKGKKSCAGCGLRDYAGNKVNCPECEARQRVDIQTEAADAKIKDGKGLFGGKRAAPFGAKKPLLMMMLIKKGGKKAKAGKMDEDFDKRRAWTCPVGHGPESHGIGRKFGPGAMLQHHECPTCSQRRQETGGGLKVKMKKLPNAYESLRRNSLFLVNENSAHRFFKNPEHAAKHGQKFLDNIQRMREGKIGRRKKASA